MKEGWDVNEVGGRAVRNLVWVGGGERHSCLYCLARRQDSVSLEAGSRGLKSIRAVGRPDEEWSLPGPE